MGCSRYPQCKNTRAFPEGVGFSYADHRLILKEALEEHAQERSEEAQTDLNCPTCGAPLELRQGKFGRFYGCTRYPQCKGSLPYYVGVPCPRCGAELVERYSPKAKRVFYGCSRYPDCQFISNEQPVELCPQCSQGVLVKRKDKLICSNKECDHAEPLPEQVSESVEG